MIKVEWNVNFEFLAMLCLTQYELSLLLSVFNSSSIGYFQIEAQYFLIVVGQHNFSKAISKLT